MKYGKKPESTNNRTGGKVALVIIFNHRYDNNINKLNYIYGHRFSHIYYLMPFYDGDLKNVIPVYENSHYFQGYIAQSLWFLREKTYMHYIFIGDDLVLHPIINEQNYDKHLGLHEDTAFLPEFISLHEHKGHWRRITEAYNYDMIQSGIDIEKALPSYQEAINAFNKFDFKIMPLSYSQIYGNKRYPTNSTNIVYDIKLMLRNITHRILRRKYELSYPLIGGYSDIVIVPSKNIEKFAHYCGVFSATKLFVEIALPTALVLSSDKIMTEKYTSLKGKYLWSESDLAELDKYDYNIKKLLDNFPDNLLFIHPVKLSKWRQNE